MVERKQSEEQQAMVGRRTLVQSALKLGLLGWTAGPAAHALGLIGPSEAATPEGTVANLFDSLGDEWFIDEVAGAKEAAEALGFSTQNLTFGNDPATQASQVQDGVTRGVKMFAIYAPLGQGLTQMVSAAGDTAHLAFEYDIPPWTYPSVYGPAYGFYLVDNIAPGAYAAGKQVLNMIGGKGNVVVMPGFPGWPGQ